jgi:mono/diheme cytochrome c family protein
MNRRLLAILGGASLCIMVPAASQLAQQQGRQVSTPARAQTPAARPTPATMSPESRDAFVKQYCQGCHNPNLKSGGMTLTSLDLAHPDQNGELAEKVIRKVRVGMMPPATARTRPDHDTAMAFVTALESDMDRAAALHPNPGSRPFQRLTRDEYARSVRDLLGIDVDVAQFLPPDTLSDGLDNIADSQSFTPALMEGYIRAAAKISREALGDPKATPASAVYKLPRTGSQLRHVDDAPYGTRGGIAVTYNFPADGEYNFRSLLHGTPTGGLFGNVPGEELEIAIDGERISLQTIDQSISEALPTGLNMYSGKIFVKAGPHLVSSAFIQKHSVLVDDDIAEIEHVLADTDIGRDRELTEYPHLREFEISGPYNVTGVSDTPTRKRVFTCRPLSPGEELPCASKIVTDLARQAFRRPVTSEDMEGLMTFFEDGRKKSGFEGGIRSALEAILASFDFVARVEVTPDNVKPGQKYRISDLELASRLSYFLWNSAPDNELISLATQGRLRDPLVLEKQVKRMLVDSRAETLSTKFAGQWLHLPDVENLHPDSFYYPQYDHVLAMAMKRETELFFNSIVEEDRNVLDLLTADYTFLNERVAKHYGISSVAGAQFQRVQLKDDYRRGLLGKGAILALTSVADRTSPVLRGKWVMGVLLGTPPPQPPPAVPKLEQTAGVADGKTLTVRERMEAHRANPTCYSCHSMIDPIGLALENFDVTGKWRTRDNTYAISNEGFRIHTMGDLIDASTKMYDGTVVNGPSGLRAALLKHSDMFIRNLTEKLLAYALGRRVEYFDMPLVRTIDRDAAKNNDRFSSIVMGIIKSPAFQMRTAEPATTDAAGKQN